MVRKQHGMAATEVAGSQGGEEGMSEHSEITSPLIKMLRQAGVLALRMNSGKVRVRGGFMQLHDKGTADILCFPEIEGPAVWLETKAVKRDYHKEQYEAQAAFRARVEALGHKYAVVRTIDDGLLAVLRKGK